MQQSNDFGQWVVHGRTLTKKNGLYVAISPKMLTYRSLRVNPHTSESNMKTVLITGCSSGYGLETARHFLAQGWKVVATMRTPRQELFPASPNLQVLPLDVTKPESIAAALAAAGPVDVLVNNAGVGLFGAFEVTPMSTVRDIFETNTFGVMAMCQAILPRFMRAARGPS